MQADGRKFSHARKSGSPSRIRSTKGCLAHIQGAVREENGNPLRACLWGVRGRRRERLRRHKL